MKNVFGDEDMGRAATTLFHAATTKRTDQNYSSNLKSFFEFGDVSLLEHRAAPPFNITRYIAWLGERGIVAASSIQPYLSSINKYLQDHALPLVALGPLALGSEKASQAAKRTWLFHPNDRHCRRP